MWPYCALWLYGAGLPLAPCFGPWWVWGAPVAQGEQWWGPWGQRRPESPPKEGGGLRI
ncbi:MAG TPA: hypothetical protein VNT01_09530 [Symbiobacteriaceae bacterium]|nr:hypothetical protein [Symbiobacteriaceae bacterium]